MPTDTTIAIITDLLAAKPQIVYLFDPAELEGLIDAHIVDLNRGFAYQMYQAGAACADYHEALHEAAMLARDTLAVSHGPVGSSVDIVIAKLDAALAKRPKRQQDSTNAQH